MGIVGIYHNWYSISHLAKTYEVKNQGTRVRDTWELWEQHKKHLNKPYRMKLKEHMREKFGTSLRKTIGKSYRDHFRGSKTLNPKRREKKLGLLFYS
jgi:hypothetical protein